MNKNISILYVLVIGFFSISVYFLSVASKHDKEWNKKYRHTDSLKIEQLKLEIELNKLKLQQNK